MCVVAIDACFVISVLFIKIVFAVVISNWILVIRVVIIVGSGCRYVFVGMCCIDVLGLVVVGIVIDCCFLVICFIWEYVIWY